MEQRVALKIVSGATPRGIWVGVRSGVKEFQGYPAPGGKGGPAAQGLWRAVGTMSTDPGLGSRHRLRVGNDSDPVPLTDVDAISVPPGE